MAVTPGPGDLATPQAVNERIVVAPPVAPPSGVAEQVGVQADVANKLLATLRGQQQQNDVNAADMDASVRLTALRDKYKADKDWQTAPARALAEASEMLGTYGQNMRGVAAQNAWKAQTAQLSTSFHAQVSSDSRQTGVDQAKGEVIAIGDKAVDIAGDITQPLDVRQKAVAAFAASLQGAVDRGLIGEDEAAAREKQFADEAKAKRQNGLQAQALDLLDQNPTALVSQLNDKTSPFAEMEPTTIENLKRMAGRDSAEAVLTQAYTQVARTGEVVPEDSPALKPVWTALGQDAKLQYAERVAAMAEAHATLSGVKSLAGLSLAEIISQADEARRNGTDGRLHGAALHMIERDPATYVLTQNPILMASLNRARAALEAAQANPNDPTAKVGLRKARGAYVAQLLDAQDALGLPPGMQRIYRTEDLLKWARNLKQNPDDYQMATLNALPHQMLSLLGDKKLADKAVDEYMSAYYGVQKGPLDTGATAAATGADYATTKLKIKQAIRVGNQAAIDVLVGRLSKADQLKLTRELDPENLK